jgi:hypothetical protein
MLDDLIVGIMEHWNNELLLFPNTPSLQHSNISKLCLRFYLKLNIRHERR